MVGTGVQSPPLDLLPRGKNIAIIHTRWNEKVVGALVKETISVLKEFDSVVEVHAVPGSYELPFAAKSLAVTFKYDAIITIGVLIKGQTMHFEYISSAVSDGLMRVQLETMCPVIFGVLTCLTEEQAEARAGLLEGSHNHGKDWAYAALEMVKYKKQ